MFYPSGRTQNVLNRALQVTVFLYQIVAVAVFISTLFLATPWLNGPFLGGFFEHTFVFNGINTIVSEEQWQINKNYTLGDQLVAVESTEIRNATQLRALLDSHQVGDEVAVQMRLQDGTVDTTDITLIALSPSDRYAFYFIPEFLSFVFLLVSLWTFGLRRTEPAGRAFSIFTASLSIAVGSIFDLYTLHRFTYIWTFALAMSGGSLIDLGLGFPQEARVVIGRPYLRWTGYIAGVFLFINSYGTLFNFRDPTAYINAWQVIYTFVGLSILFYFLMLIYSATRSLSPVVKSQARTILAGSIISFGPITVWLLARPILVNFWGSKTSFSPSLLIFLIVFPLVNGYVILRFRLLRTDFWLRQGFVYALLSLLVIAILGFLVSGITLLLPVRSDNPYFIVGLVFFLVLLLNPARIRLQAFVDATFFRGQRAYEDSLRNFSHQLTNTMNLDSVAHVLRQQIMASLTPDRFYIYTYDQINDQYIALPDQDGRPASDIRFASGSPLVQYFQSENIPLYLDTINPPALLRRDEARLTLLGARLFVALRGEDRPVGWLALGNPLSGEVYTPQDLDFLENIADQASVAISRVQTVENLERRVQEMNALSRVSQGVNVTLAFDDILELIFAQTSQIIPSSYFHIILANKTAGYFFYGFRVDDNERMNAFENQPLAKNLGLGQEVAQTARPIITQDYSRECQSRNQVPSAQGVYAWMGVPLNSGADTIGALSVGSRDAAVTYTRAQLDLLQSVADQTVGAIVKARLLQETEQRAHQLATLNEITRQLTSTLEQEPLLQNILDNAVSILNCEAGTLFLVDEQTGDLIFRVTVGPVAGNLLGQKIPAGTGVVGKAVESRLPVIENEGQISASKFDETDKQTGFTSRSLLAVPMMIKDRVLGVIEVLNRRDGLPFVAEDQSILTAFAGQAAVAIENARLLALTDQELAARLEELQVMGRIVRELNASLEVDRAMRITLEWAMRQSNAEAGLVGMLEKDQLRLMAQSGYEDVFTDPSNGHISADMPTIKSALETGQPSQVSLISTAEKGFLPTAHSQIIIPIRREADVIGVILLESNSDSQENLAFLNRLSDNAAIAIYNAQLYDEVQRANDAKSEFVSFVAHELKNPMTSIKGYTELLAAGSVGQINDMQTNFLHTIRANVERMSVLVSDLNDNAKIEAGRLRLDYRAVDIDEIIDEVLRSTKRQIDDKKQKVSLNMVQGMPRVWADPVRIGQVLTNLVSNAHKYTQDGGTITVGAEATQNQWDPDGVQNVVHLYVKDDGIGISAEDQVKIFQKFFRSDDSKAREAPGTGLGLNITKSLVEMQGGVIWFESQYREGTTFHFTIPVAEG